MKPLDTRSKRLLAALLAVVAATTLVLLLPLLSPKGDDLSGESLVGVIPEADLGEEEESKTDSYRRGDALSHSDYWDSLAEAEEEQDRSPERGSRRPAAATVDDLFGDCRDAPQPSGQPGGGPSRRGGGGSAASPAVEAVEDAATPEPLSDEPPKEVTAARPQVKRSGAVGSLDEDVSADLGNGFSTLDGTDRWVGPDAGKPYRCMFIRDEKVRSGQRITVRLLEDLLVGGVHIPRNTHLQGVVTVSERMEISLTSLDIGGRILLFRFEAVDTDGGRGIYCSDLSEARRQATDQGLATANATLNSRLGRVARDAAAVGASIVRGKGGEATVSVPAGYTFYIIEKTN